MAVSKGAIEACSQDYGSMVTEPPSDGQRTPLQDVESLYIGGAEPASFAGPLRAKSRLRAIAGESLATTMELIATGSIVKGTSTRLNDE